MAPTGTPDPPLILGGHLAARLEATLADDVGSFVAAIARLEPGGPAGRERVAGGWANATGPHRFGNRLQGAGLGGPVTDDDLMRLEAFYAARGLPVEVEVCPVADPSLLRALVTRGYRPVSFRNVYGHDLRTLPPHPGSVEVVAVSDELGVRRWSDTILDGFGYDAPADRARVAWWNHLLAGLPEASLLLALDHGEAVGAANLLIRGATASLGGTATRTGHRRRGVQAALLAARLRQAHDAGCTLAVVTADPGSTSARNCERAGFRLASTNLRLRR